MKIKIFSLWVFCIFFSFCAGTPTFQDQNPYRELHAYTDITVDFLWRCTRQALDNIGFQIVEFDQESGFIKANWKEEEGIYRADLDQEAYTPKRVFPQRSTLLTLVISESSGKVTLLCQSLTRGGPYTVNRSEKNRDEAKRFFSEVEKLLVKK